MLRLIFFIFLFGLFIGGCSSPIKKVKLADYDDSTDCDVPIYKKITVKYSNGLTIHQGIMALNGCHGILTIGYFSDRLKKIVDVEQKIIVKGSANEIILQGYTPVLSGTSTPIPTYAPDNFLFNVDHAGVWTGNICDDKKQCSPVEISPP